MNSLFDAAFLFEVKCVDSVEQRVNYSRSVSNSRTAWTTIATVPANVTMVYDFLYVVTVTVRSEYDNLEYRIVSNWLDFGKEQRGRAGPASAVVKPATHCTSE